MNADELYQIPGHQVYQWLLDNAVMTETERDNLDDMDDDELREFALDFLK